WGLISKGGYVVNHFNAGLTVQGKVKSVDPRAGRCELALRSGDVMTVQFGPATWFTVLSNADGVGQDKVAEPEEQHPTDLAHRIAKYVRPRDVIFVRGIL